MNIPSLDVTLYPILYKSAMCVIMAQIVMAAHDSVVARCSHQSLPRQIATFVVVVVLSVPAMILMAFCWDPKSKTKQRTRK